MFLKLSCLTPHLSTALISFFCFLSLSPLGNDDGRHFLSSYCAEHPPHTWELWTTLWRSQALPPLTPVDESLQIQRSKVTDPRAHRCWVADQERVLLETTGAHPPVMRHPLSASETKSLDPWHCTQVAPVYSLCLITHYRCVNIGLGTFSSHSGNFSKACLIVLEKGIFLSRI